MSLKWYDWFLSAFTGWVVTPSDTCPGWPHIKHGGIKHRHTQQFSAVVGFFQDYKLWKNNHRHTPTTPPSSSPFVFVVPVSSDRVSLSLTSLGFETLRNGTAAFFAFQRPDVSYRPPADLHVLLQVLALCGVLVLILGFVQPQPLRPQLVWTQPACNVFGTSCVPSVWDDVSQGLLAEHSVSAHTTGSYLPFTPSWAAKSVGAEEVAETVPCPAHTFSPQPLGSLQAISAEHSLSREQHNPCVCFTVRRSQLAA